MTFCEAIVPTLKKRAFVILTPELEQVLNEYQEATGASPARFIAQIMTESIPMIRNLTRAAIAARKSPEQALLMLQSVIDQGLENAHRKADLFEQQTRELSKSSNPKMNKSVQLGSPAVERKKVGRGKQQIQAERSDA
uniref:hypothetical protein n=1 Tax=Pseudomonas sp. TaxID=306 RepID=UPI00159ED85E|nr:hypothetical protein [Pseudomonas sp.]